MNLNDLSNEQINQLVALADALNKKLREFRVTEYVSILGIEANRGGRCFLSDSKEPGGE